MTVFVFGRGLLAVGITLGTLCWIATFVLAFFFRGRAAPAGRQFEHGLPPVTLFKPVYGLEKHLRANLRTACLQNYPRYQVIFSVQRADDPAISLLRELELEFGRERVTVVVACVQAGLNGKINNLCGAFPHARHDVLVISDSDVALQADFLRSIVSPLADPGVGAVTTFFRATGAEPWYEKLEQLTLNADQFAMAMLASATNVVQFCFGASTALTRDTLTRIGGFEAFGETLVEDTEMGRRIRALGAKLVAVPYVVDVTVDLASPRAWARKQIYWDQNTLAAVPVVFAVSFCLRVIPLALLLAALRAFDSLGLALLAAATLVRVASAAAVLGVALRDRVGLRALWLLPLKDSLGIVWALRALFSRTVEWRGVELTVERGGRLVPVAAKVARTADQQP